MIIISQEVLKSEKIKDIHFSLRQSGCTVIGCNSASGTAGGALNIVRDE